MNWKTYTFLLIIILLLVGNVGASTLTVNASYDRRILSYTATSATWYDMRNLVYTAGGAPINPAGTNYIKWQAVATTDQYQYSYRAGMTFPTSALPDDATNVTGVLSLYGSSKTNALGAIPLAIVDFTPLNPTSYVVGDFNRTSFTRYSTDIPYASVSTTGWNDFTLNAAALANVNKTGYTTVLATTGNDVDNTTLTWASNAVSNIYVASASSTTPPKIVFTFTSAPETAFTANVTTGYSPLVVQFTDQTLDDPTSWAWSYKNETVGWTVFSNSQNPAYSFPTGLYDINLTATNAYGSNTATKTYYIGSNTVRINTIHTGDVGQWAAQNSFTAMRNLASGDGNADNQTSGSGLVHLATTTTTDQWQKDTRHFIVFDTSVVPDDAVITYATFSVSGYWKSNSFTTGFPLSLVDGFPVDTTNFANGDFSKTTFTRQAADITYAATTASTTNPSYNNFALTNLTWINKTGKTTYGLITGWEVDNASPTWQSNKDCQWQMWGAASANPEYIIINFTSNNPAPVAAFTCTKSFLRIPNSVTCTDSSTNTPTNWSWNMGDGSAAKTTQNVTYQYLKRGVWGITLNATNSGGSNITPMATSIKVVGFNNLF